MKRKKRRKKINLLSSKMKEGVPNHKLEKTNQLMLNKLTETLKEAISLKMHEDYRKRL